MSEDLTDLLALTAGHFLVGGHLLSIVEPEPVAALKVSPLTISHSMEG